jgi:hypothetical protein
MQEARTPRPIASGPAFSISPKVGFTAAKVRWNLLLRYTRCRQQFQRPRVSRRHPETRPQNTNKPLRKSALYCEDSVRKAGQRDPFQSDLDIEIVATLSQPVQPGMISACHPTSLSARRN